MKNILMQQNLQGSVLKSWKSATEKFNFVYQALLKDHRIYNFVD